MNDKRFVYEEEHFPVAMEQIRNIKTGETYDLEECCDLLNEFYDKIISLETELDFLQMENNGIKYVLKNIRQIELKR